ncbi:hypothetical protein EEL32_12225 [Brevibacillus laterosporus]|nr:hypothetical protein [Brevibacillus laterosporus]TPG86869.1 hypothetical protein EEL32_12225 [Brevibacillus laterosporus]
MENRSMKKIETVTRVILLLLMLLNLLVDGNIVNYLLGISALFIFNGIFDSIKKKHTSSMINFAFAVFILYPTIKRFFM